MIAEKLQKIEKEQLQKLIFYGLAVFVFLLPVPHLFMPEKENAIAIQATILTLALVYFGVLFFTACKRGWFSFRSCGIARKCAFGLALVGVVSLLISERKDLALYGTELRWEGLLSLLSYYMLFLITTLLENKEYRRKLLYLFLLLGCLVTVLGLMQYLGIYVFGNKFGGMAYVPMRNPNFYGAFAVLFTGAGMGGFFAYEKESEVTHPFSWWKRGVWYALVLAGYAACICARSTLVYAGLIMMLLMYLCLELVTKRRRILSFLALVAGLLGLIFLFDLYKDGGVTAEIKTISNQIEAEGTVFGDSVGSGRMQIWKETISLLPKYGLQGCGIEQLGLHRGESYMAGDGLNFDKAHNEYLNLWVTEGIFALVIYLVFLFALFIPGLRQFFEDGKQSREKRDDDITKIAFFAFFGYIAQAFFNISVVQVAPYFWIMCGLLYSRKRSKNEEKTDC